MADYLIEQVAKQEVLNVKNHFSKNFGEEKIKDFDPYYIPLEIRVFRPPLACFEPITILIQAIENPPGFSDMTIGGRIIECGNLSMNGINEAIRRYREKKSSPIENISNEDIETAFKNVSDVLFERMLRSSNAQMMAQARQIYGKKA